MARILTTLDAFPADMATPLSPTAGPLCDHVQGYLFRNCVFDREMIRPVAAVANPMLVLRLGDVHEAFEYVTGRVRELPEAMLVGPQSRRPADLIISGRHVVFIVSFQPGALAGLFGIHDAEFLDTAVDAAGCMGAGVTALVDRLRGLHSLGGTAEDLKACVEAFLQARLSACRDDGPIHRAALTLHRSLGIVSVDALAAESSLSLRHFSRAFQQQFGMTPKHYARVIRFSHAMRLKLDRPRLSWTEVSQEAGYYDQNHMAKEFKFLVGEGPSAFLKSVTSWPAQSGPTPLPAAMSDSY